MPNSEETQTSQPPIIPAIAHAFLADDLNAIDPRLEHWLHVLTQVGANQCWHKRSTFKAHLYHVYQILKMWGQDDTVCSCGLFHSAFSNSYVNLAIFKAEEDGRSRLKDLVGDEAEELIHFFCIVPRHELIYEKLLCTMDTSDDVSSLVVPREGVVVKHIHTGEPLLVDRYTLAQIIIMTIADFSEQLFSWQDCMFENGDGKLHFAGNNPAVLWPGPMKPGLWHSALSRLGLLLRSCLDDVEEVAEGGRCTILGRPAPPFPPVFQNCTKLLLESDQRAARDQYWEAITSCYERESHDEAKRLLEAAISHNPHVAEPHIIMAQLHLHRGEAPAALSHARRGLELLLEWGTAWDKRLSWDAWAAWTRVMLQTAEAGEGLSTRAFGILNLGMVKDLENARSGVHSK